MDMKFFLFFLSNFIRAKRFRAQLNDASSDKELRFCLSHYIYMLHAYRSIFHLNPAALEQGALVYSYISFMCFAYCQLNLRIAITIEFMKFVWFVFLDLFRKDFLFSQLNKINRSGIISYCETVSLCLEEKLLSTHMNQSMFGMNFNELCFATDYQIQRFVCLFFFRFHRFRFLHIEWFVLVTHGSPLCV